MKAVHIADGIDTALSFSGIFEGPFTVCDPAIDVVDPS